MKRELFIIVSIFLFIIILICVKSILIPSSEPIVLYKIQNGEKIKQSVFQPLDKIEIHYPTLKSVTAVTWQITDGKGVVYIKNTSLFYNSTPKPISFTPGHTLGKHIISIKYSLKNGKFKTSQNQFRLIAETTITTNNPVWNSFYPLLKNVILKNRRTINIGDRQVTGYRAPDTTPIFLRDHTYQMKGFKYFETVMKSAVDYFLDNQQSNGKYLEILWINPETKKVEIFRNEAEADPEYLAVLAAYQIWQTTGDDEWIKGTLEKLEKGFHYSMTDSFRWSKKYQLVKRPYTIDTWDFELYNPGWPYDVSKAKMGIMHGDNSGMYDACVKLSILFQYFGNIEKSKYWQEKADTFKIQLNKICWNGKFYTHRIDIDPVDVKGVDTGQILSLSNAYDINRGVTSHQQAVSIIQEYQARKKSLNPKPFAEWFSIQPFFPSGSFETSKNSWTYQAGQYINGGILPLVGGELATASFRHGFESYAISILEKYFHMVDSTGTAYLWYHWDGRPGISDPDTFSSDGWGAAAMLNAFIEGLAGVEDQTKLYNEVKCSPRWISSNATNAKVITKYAASDGYFAYQYNYNLNENILKLHYTGSGTYVNFSILLPADKQVKQVFQNDQVVPFTISTIENSRYLDFSSPMNKNSLKIVLNTI